MHPDLCPLSRLDGLLRAEAELFSNAEREATVLCGELCHEHPMAWRYLSDLQAVEALTLIAPSIAEFDAMPPWHDPGWVVSPQQPLPGQTLTLWWHAATQQAMLASCIALNELRQDAVVSTLRLHREGLALCRRLAWPAEAMPAHRVASDRLPRLA